MTTPEPATDNDSILTLEERILWAVLTENDSEFRKLAKEYGLQRAQELVRSKGFVHRPAPAPSLRD
jgi:hypothetical protein